MRLKTCTILILTLALLLTPMSAFAGDQPQNGYYIVGFVYHDLDEDMARDSGEPGLEGVEIRLTTPSAALETTLTNSDGLFFFSPSTTGYYTLEEIDPPGYESTTVNTRTIFFYPGYSDTVLFGDVALNGVGLQGTVYNDLDRDGEMDAGEPGVPGAGIQLFNPEDGPLQATTSGADGAFTFPDLDPGSYTLVETDPEGYYSTTPNRREIELTEDTGTLEVNFGDFQPEEGEFTEVDLAILDYFDLPLHDLLLLREDRGWGYGEIARALFLVDLSEATLAEILAMRAQGAGWGEITKAFMDEASLKGHNLGLIMSGRDGPSTNPNPGQAKKADACGLAPEEYAGYIASFGQGLVNRACKLAAQQAVPAENIFSMLESGMSFERIKQELTDIPDALEPPSAGERDGGNGNGNGPPPCKGKNKNKPGC